MGITQPTYSLLTDPLKLFSFHFRSLQDKPLGQYGFCGNFIVSHCEMKFSKLKVGLPRFSVTSSLEFLTIHLIFRQRISFLVIFHNCFHQKIRFPGKTQCSVNCILQNKLFKKYLILSIFYPGKKVLLAVILVVIFMLPALFWKHESP